MSKKRIIGLDFVRFLAVFFVISVHFFLNTGFYDITLNRLDEIFLLFFRYLFYTCVPLFLMLTGYFAHNKRFDRNYFYKIIKIFISYLIIAIVVVIFRISFMEQVIGKKELLFSFFSFEADPYAWYVEMYLGLFLLIPFLNIVYDSIDKNQKRILIIVCLFLTALPSLINNFVIHGTYVNIVPDYWNTIYPVTYFFIGKYLKEFPINFSKIKLFIVGLLVLIIHSILVFSYCFGNVFDWGVIGGYGNLFTVALAVIIFSLFYDKDIKNKIVSSLIVNVSKLSLEIYLISYVFDNLFYRIIKLNFNTTLNYLINYFVYVPIIFICSTVSAFIINKISEYLVIKFKPVYDRIMLKLFNKKVN